MRQPFEVEGDGSAVPLVFPFAAVVFSTVFLQSGALGFVELTVVVCIGFFETLRGFFRVLAIRYELILGEDFVAVGVAVLVGLRLAFRISRANAESKSEEQSEDGSCFHR